MIQSFLSSMEWLALSLSTISAIKCTSKFNLQFSLSSFLQNAPIPFIVNFRGKSKAKGNAFPSSLLSSWTYPLFFFCLSTLLYPSEKGAPHTNPPQHIKPHQDWAHVLPQWPWQGSFARGKWSKSMQWSPCQRQSQIPLLGCPHKDYDTNQVHMCRRPRSRPGS